MNTVIFRTIAPTLAAIMLVFSIFVLLRGHNEPGGGFIGGLIAASAVAIYGIGASVTEVRRAIRLDPLSIAGVGVVLAGASGLVSAFFDVPFMTSQWLAFEFADSEVVLSTPMIFDIGVYLVVFGTISAVALALEEPEQ
ncbi:MAG: Na(+)/H(+) antiporter subunit B [Alphaproteobacteria bacterium]|nr:Na(+)/H(+) antiporter subunit B [Alphaproteobacteria bacterium]